MIVCPWCDYPDSEDYDCHKDCKCVCHHEDEYLDALRSA